MSTRTELGCAGHYICAHDCRWRRHTQVIGDCGRYRISTVGDMWSSFGGVFRRMRVNCNDDAYYQSAVFTIQDEPDGRNDGCGCHPVTSYEDVETASYATAGEAQAGHERLVAYYMRAADGDER